jgi:hypothetical protein
MKRLFCGAAPCLAVALLLGAAAPVGAQMCPFSMRSQVQMQMQWQMQAQQQQYMMNMQQQAMRSAQLQMNAQMNFNHGMMLNHRIVPPLHQVHFQHPVTPHLVHTFHPTIHMQQVRHVTPHVTFHQQTHIAHITRAHIIHPVGHRIGHPHLIRTHQTVVQHRVVPQLHLHQRTTTHLTTHLNHQTRIVHVAQPRRNDIHRPARHLTTQTRHNTATAKTHVSVATKHTPPAKHQETLTKTDTNHKASLRIRMSTTMTCGNCHMTAPQRPSLVLMPPRGPDVIALVPPIVPDLGQLRLPVPADIAAVKPRLKKPQGPAGPDRIPVADAPPLLRIPAGQMPPLTGTPAGKGDTTTSLSRQPALPSLSSATTSPSMKLVEKISSCVAQQPAESQTAQTDVTQPPQLPALAGEIMQVALQPGATEAKDRIVAIEAALVPDDLRGPPPLPALVPPGPSMPVEVAVAKTRTPSLAEIVGQAPPLPPLRP